MAFRTFVVANPRAGAGQVEREWERLERLFRKQFPEFDYAFTQGPNHATLLTREALRKGWEMVVAVGGDGTCNEVVNGFFEERVDGAAAAAADFEQDDDGWIQISATRTREGSGACERELNKPINPDAVMGLVPMGTGGDFRKTIGIVGSVQENIERLGGDDTEPCDVGQVAYIGHDGKLSSRCFINIASCGLSGKTDNVVNNMCKCCGALTFRLASIWAWASYRNQPIDVRLDGQEEMNGRFFMIAVANGQFFGGGMHVAPGADTSDGQFEVVLMRDLAKLESARLITKIYDGTHLDFDETFRREAKLVQMRAPGDAAVLIDLDGEQPGRLPATYLMHHHALRLKV